MDFNSVDFIMTATLEELDEYAQNGDIDLNILVRIRELPESFLSKYIDKMNTARIIRYQNISEEFVRNNINFFTINDIKAFKHKLKIQNLVKESLRTIPEAFGI